MSGSSDFNPWLLNWEPEHIQRFWDWVGSNPAFENLYFSRVVGDAILGQVSKNIPLTGKVVDLGAGPGYLVDKLLGKKINTLAIDSSVESVAVLTKRFQGNPFFMGARVNSTGSIPVEDGFADTVLLIEAIEHFDDITLHNILGEIRRMTKHDGYVVITTPNEENLAESQIMCPNCGCLFHKVQHLRSFSQKTLGEIMKSVGFTEIICRPTLFSRFPKRLWFFHRMAMNLTRTKLPHLIYIGCNA
jgi:2-polyprenyl-3-methyl-5-hydroxy-6-metoxy-1,4-benzoquinol methylase